MVEFYTGLIFLSKHEKLKEINKTRFHYCGSTEMVVLKCSTHFYRRNAVQIEKVNTNSKGKSSTLGNQQWGKFLIHHANTNWSEKPFNNMPVRLTERKCKLLLMIAKRGKSNYMLKPMPFLVRG